MTHGSAKRPPTNGQYALHSAGRVARGDGGRGFGRKPVCCYPGRLSSASDGLMVMFTFPSEAHATAWYNDPDYQALSEHRRAGTELKFLTMVHGLPPRG